MTDPSVTGPSAAPTVPRLDSGGRLVHDMPFGAMPQPGGGVRFRLWAPSVPSLTLVLGEGAAERRLPMQPAADGWFELFVAEAGPGSHYRYALPGGLLVPDPASRGQAQDVHGPSVVVDPGAFLWHHADFPGRPWEETVLYELHVGTFTPDGSFRAVIDRLDHLEMLGVTAIELMPVADFAGRRGWGYDGVLPFAPDRCYGTPDDLKALVDAVHARGMTIFLDVVYNHFGPEGNYLHAYAAPTFTDRHHTPWGAALNFDGPDARPVRDLVIHNALYWLEEFRFDGLRLDAVDSIRDDSDPDILTELARSVRARFPGRHVHLVLENGLNAVDRLERDAAGQPLTYTAQWDDDWHHAAHVLLTGERDGYYADYAEDAAAALVTALTEGFVYQGQPSVFHGMPSRGQPSGLLTPLAFVTYLQNHDQIGNRGSGDRLVSQADPRALRVMTGLHLLSPQIPLLFMGQEWGARTPFLFFCDFHGDLAGAVRDGRRREFAAFTGLADPAVLTGLPDPNAEATLLASRLDWDDLAKEEHEDWLAWTSLLLTLRRNALMPRLSALPGGLAQGRVWDGHAAAMTWTLADGATLSAVATLGGEGRAGFARPPGDLLLASAEDVEEHLAQGRLPGWSAAWFLTGGSIGHP
ncbi:malto-oligosyltrehalose trehalohydrolase [Oleisolibacter albus]|uniref:malto-oligosyltrehalose trehalohydrolase n=1 Tax=Oleisolibacter albus TaxID=2171757 RepID=UPI001EFC86B4|nr:malto-oligosyltrehalose trehalohydrolase [Oleisolibacter albus]